MQPTTEHNIWKPLQSQKQRIKVFFFKYSALDVLVFGNTIYHSNEYACYCYRGHF